MEETSLTLVDEPSNPHTNSLGCLYERMLVVVMPLSQNPRVPLGMGEAQLTVY